MENNKKRRILGIIMIVFIIVGVILIFNGFDKLNYSNSKYSSTNAYVGGDAYNYIINASYFTGYLISGMICELSAVIIYCTKSISIMNETSIEKSFDKKELDSETFEKIQNVFKSNQREEVNEE